MRSGKVGTINNNTNMPDYFRSSTNKAADKRPSEVLTNAIHVLYSGIGHLWVHLVCR